MWSGKTFKFSIFRFGVTQEMAKAIRSGVGGWPAFVGVVPFLLGAFRWLSLLGVRSLAFPSRGWELACLSSGENWSCLSRVELALPFWRLPLCPQEWESSVWPCLPRVWWLAFLKLCLARPCHGWGWPFLLWGFRHSFSRWGGWPFLIAVVLLSGWNSSCLLSVGVGFSFSRCGFWPSLQGPPFSGLGLALARLSLVALPSCFQCSPFPLGVGSWPSWPFAMKVGPAFWLWNCEKGPKST